VQSQLCKQDSIRFYKCQANFAKLFHPNDPVYERFCDSKELCVFAFLSMIEGGIAENDDYYGLFALFSI